MGVRVVRIGLLGGVSAVTDDGAALDIGPAKCQTVLAVLALAAGSAVPVSRIVELVWGDAPPRTADKTLQSYVVRLRSGLGADAIVRTGDAYRLVVPAGAVDVARFRRQLDLGEVVAALTEWTGTPLAGLDAPGLSPIVDGLVEQWLAAVESDLAHRVETDAPGVIGPLTELTAQYPFREGLWSLLMTALYRVGRQSDALAAFQHARGHLVEQLGVEPGAGLRELESRILDHDERLRGGGPSDRATGRPTGTVTFGFCAVENAGRLWATNQKKTAAAMARLDELVRAVVNRQGGFLFVIGGDSFGAAFHRADDAAAWATELQLAVNSEPWAGGVEPRLRIGLHTGETEEAANGYFGAAVNTAERLAGAGHGGQTLVSEVTAALLDRAHLTDLGVVRLDDDVVTEQHIFGLGDGTHPALRNQHNGNIPPRLGRLIGRDQELDAIAGALAQSPVVTLVGPGGIGKTRLALAVAQASVHGRGGAWLIDLTSITSSSDVPRALADILGVKERPGRNLTRSIVLALQALSALLVLDNCEHVIDGAAALAHAVAQGCPMVHVLATSREALGIDGEQLLPVAPLDPAGSAAELFDERARAVCVTFDAAAARADVEEICRRLDGIPLAIELAAARSRTLTPPDLVARLGDRLGLLTGGRRTSAERHRTLRATVGWSYDLLTPSQQVLFRRLSIFAGPFDAPAAGNVAAGGAAGPAAVDPAAVEDLLGELVERSMLLVDSGRFGRRFRLLETVREFAAERLSADDDSALIAGRHAQWCLQQVRSIHRLLVGQDEAEGVLRLAELWPNLRAGVDWAFATDDRELVDALVRPVVGEVNLRQQTEISDWAERILALPSPTAQEGAPFWLVCATYRCKQSGDHDRYEALVQRLGDPDHPLVRYSRAYIYDDGDGLIRNAPDAVAWLRSHGAGHPAELAEIGGVAAGLMNTGRFGELDVFLSALAARYRAHGPPTLLYVALSMLGYSAMSQRKPDLADRFFEDAMGVDVPERTVSVNRSIEARVAFRRGNRPAAFRTLRDYVDELLESDYSDLATNAAVEFINMMAAIDRFPAAAIVLGYLRAAGDFGALAASTLVADAAARIAAGRPAGTNLAPEPRLDARHALTYMRGVLDELLETDYPDDVSRFTGDSAAARSSPESDAARPSRMTVSPYRNSLPKS